MLLMHLALTAAPPVAATLLAMRAGVRDLPILLGIALVGSGAGAMLAFWAYYADPIVGEVVSFLLVLGSIQAIAWAWYAGLDRALLRRLALPAALWALAAAFVVFLGFVHGGQEEPLITAATRFSHPLPGDNEIPRHFADWFFEHGHDGAPPPYFDWLSSDRPPLQIGYVLAQRPFGWDDAGLHYQVLAVIVQQFWIVGIWAVLCAARVGRAARGLAIFAAMVSDVAILHGFFVWPKLIAAAFLLGALALVISPRWLELRRSPALGALFAALCALSLLAHGASTFLLLPLLAFAAWRAVPSPRWLGIAATVALAMLGPWVAYQRFADPPGDRLLKWQLGGSLEITDGGALETIADGYGEAGVGGTLENKWRNLETIAGVRETRKGVDFAVDSIDAGNLGDAVAAIRIPRFFALLPLLGIFLVAPIAMAVAWLRRKPDGPEWRFAVASLCFCTVATLFWALLMFGGTESAALVHVGSLALPLLAICACVVGLWVVSARLAITVVAVNTIAVLVLYVPSLTPPAGTSYSALSALLAAVALAGFGLLCWRAEPVADRQVPD
jgi:hypothetical protein